MATEAAPAAAPPLAAGPHLPRRAAVVVFLAFAIAYFLSALLRAVTATLSPVLVETFGLSAQSLGLLGGAYFAGFALMQWPLGHALDRWGPRPVVLALLSVAVLGCLAFALAQGFAALLAARFLIGVGVSACLMAALTGYRRWFDAAAQLRANAWMLMTGSLGMVASTLPVQWLLPLTGWRALFVMLAALVAMAMGLIAWRVPAVPRCASAAASVAARSAAVWRHPVLRRLAALAFFSYGGLVAMQTLWAAPWMTQVLGYRPEQAAQGLFWINLSMLATFWTWGWVQPALMRRGFGAQRLIAWGLPLSFALLAIIIIAGSHLSALGYGIFCLYCVASSFVTLAQPAVGLSVAPEAAGRALTAVNLLIFLGVFAVQWGIGLLIDGLQRLGLDTLAAYRAAFAVFLLCCVAAYVRFLWGWRGGAGDNPAS